LAPGEHRHRPTATVRGAKTEPLPISLPRRLRHENAAIFTQDEKKPIRKQQRSLPKAPLLPLDFPRAKTHAHQRSIVEAKEMSTVVYTRRKVIPHSFTGIDQIRLPGRSI